MTTYQLLNQEERVQPALQYASTTGRTVGILLFLQLITALTLPFILSKPITLGSPAILTAVTAHSFQIRSAVLLSFVGSGLTVYLGITAFQVFRRYSTSLALLFLVVCVVSYLLDLVHAGSIMALLSFSNQYVTSGAQNTELYQVVGVAVTAARRSAHMTQLLAIGAWMFVFYISLLRFHLIPRVLAVLGLLGISLQFVGVTFMMLLGFPLINQMAMPLLPIQILVAGWLIIKGFNKPTLNPQALSNPG
jgi:hypothetical protein